MPEARFLIIMLDYFLKETWEMLKRKKTHACAYTHRYTPSEVVCWVKRVQRLLTEGSSHNSRSVQLTSRAHRPILSQCLWNGRVE